MKVSMDIAGGANSGAEEDNDETIGLRLNLDSDDMLLLMDEMAEGATLLFSTASLLPVDDESSWVVMVAAEDSEVE